MGLLKLELKRVLKTRMTIILLAAALVLSVVMAWLPTTFPRATTAEGTTLTGMAATEYLKKIQSNTAGIVTPEKIRDALVSYQDCLNRYGVENTYDLPEGVYDQELLPIAPLLHGIREAFADPDTGMAPDLMELEPDAVLDFYNVCQSRIRSLMEQEQPEHPAAQAQAAAAYGKVETPFWYTPGYNTDAMDYQLFLGYLVTMLCACLAAPIFASDRQTGADEIYRCTRYGRGKLALAKILSALTICAAGYLLCAGVYLLVSNSLFGWDCTTISMQMLYSTMNLPAWNLGQLQLACGAGYFLSLLATVSFTLYLSARCASVIGALSGALLSCVLPLVVYLGLPANIGDWIYPLLPASGTALQASFLYGFADFSYWNLGSISLWMPWVMAAACCLENVLFLVLTWKKAAK